MRIVFALYLTIALFALLVTAMDPPWSTHGMYPGVFGELATVGASLPWSLLLVKLLEGSVSEQHMVEICWIFIALNVFILYKAAYPRTRRMEGTPPPEG